MKTFALLSHQTVNTPEEGPVLGFKSCTIQSWTHKYDFLSQNRYTTKFQENVQGTATRAADTQQWRSRFSKFHTCVPICQHETWIINITVFYNIKLIVFSITVFKMSTKQIFVKIFIVVWNGNKKRTPCEKRAQNWPKIG